MTFAAPRLILYFEDRISLDGRMITGSVWNNRVPLLVRDRVVGAVFDIRREPSPDREVGWVVTGAATRSLVPFTGLSVAATFTVQMDTVTDLDEGSIVLHSPQLREVRLSESPCWTGMEIR